MIDADLARGIEQVFEQLGIDARELLARFRLFDRPQLCRRPGHALRYGFGLRLGFLLGLRLGFGFRLCFRFGLVFDFRLRFGLGLLYRLGLDICRGCLVACAGADLGQFVRQRRIDNDHADRVVRFDGKCGRLHAGFRRRQLDLLIARNLESGVSIADPLFEFGSRRYRLAGNHHVSHTVQFVDASLQQLFDAGAGLHAAFVHRDEQGFEFVAQVTHRRDTGHPGAALERMQVPLEFMHGLPRILVLHPDAERLVRRFQEFRGLFREDRSDFLVVIGLHVFRLGDDGLRLAFRYLFLRQVGNGSVGLQGIRQSGDVLDERRIIRPLLVRLVYVTDNRRYRFRGRFQGIDAGVLETDLVVINAPHQAV